MTATATETPTAEATAALLGRVRKLLAKAEAEGVTPQEAEALTGKAAELMAKYGIDRALLGKLRPETDKPADRKIDVDNPWGRVKAHLLAGLAHAVRCDCVILTGRREGAVTLHLFGFESDLERLDVLYTSLLLQMSSALQHAELPEWTHSKRAWNRSFLLGYASAVVTRVKAAEAAAATEAQGRAPAGTGTSLVLADRKHVIAQNIKRAYPITRTARVTYSGSGYGSGHREGQKANIGQTGLGRQNAGALSG